MASHARDDVNRDNGALLVVCQFMLIPSAAGQSSGEMLLRYYNTSIRSISQFYAFWGSFSGHPAARLHRTGCNIPQMPNHARHLATVLAVALLACGLSACGTINEKLAAGLSDAIPQWAGGLPADAPPRPGTAKYDEFMKERERKRLEPAPANDPAKPSLEPVH